MTIATPLRASRFAEPHRSSLIACDPSTAAAVVISGARR